MGHSRGQMQSGGLECGQLDLCEGSPAVGTDCVCIFSAAHPVLVLVEAMQEGVAVYSDKGARPGLCGIHAHTPGYPVPKSFWGPWRSPIHAVEGKQPHQGAHERVGVLVAAVVAGPAGGRTLVMPWGVHVQLGCVGLFRFFCNCRSNASWLAAVRGRALHCRFVQMPSVAVASFKNDEVRLFRVR